MRAWPLLLLGLACQPEPVPSLEPTLAQKYQASCAACHETGAADAPRTHDSAEWSRRTRRGMDALVQSVKLGTTAMPPRGMCQDCDDAHLEAIVKYMIAPQ